MRKTNAVRHLERLGVAHELVEYDPEGVDPAARGFAERVAAAVGLDPAAVLKTLACASPGAPDALLAVLPARCQLERRALARAAGRKRLDLVPIPDLARRTGFERGAVTPLGVAPRLCCFGDRSIEAWPRVAVSAGRPGLQVLLAPRELVRAANLTLVDLVRPAEAG